MYNPQPFQSSLYSVVAALLSDPGKFLESLFKFDKDNIPESCITKIGPYMDNPNFIPSAVEKASKACTSLCLWVR